MIRFPLTLILFHILPAFADLGPFTQELIRSDDMKIDRNECQKIEKELGQLLYVNVDGFKTYPDAINPAYVQMVKELNIGGVLPKFGNNKDLSAITKSTKALQRATDLPLLIGIDRDHISSEKGDLVSYGLGYGVGELGAIDDFTPQCAKRIAELQAFLHRATGLNQALGPTVEKKGTKFLSKSANEVSIYSKPFFDALNEIGVAPTMKHFPYTPEDYNLHRKSEDTKIPKEEVMEMLEIFKKSAPQSSFAMTTHLFNSNIDPKEMATFSETWIGLLRNQVGYKGLLMTDGLFMIDNYETRKSELVSKWPQQGKRKITDDHSIFAARAILAGHDMIFLEGNAGQTKRVFKDLHYFACQNTPVAKKLRERIFESHQRIKAFKEANRTVLRPNVEIPESTTKLAVDLTSGYSKSSNENLACEASTLFTKINELGLNNPTMGLNPPSSAEKQTQKTSNTKKCTSTEPIICTDESVYKDFKQRVNGIQFPSYIESPASRATDASGTR
jgi:beta-N-acetylhexosaminidase